VTELLRAWGRGDEAARDALVPIVYTELRRCARRLLRRERPDHTLSPTGLVHEAYLRLVDQQGTDYHDRAHFFAVASRVMRHVLVDHARRRSAQRRGAGEILVPLGGRDLPDRTGGLRIEELDAALGELAREHPRAAEVIELRYFGGLTLTETAQALETSPATVKRDWALARAWLHKRMNP
jgi:RNA polymerase sigma factor (TIGR02999 family)